VEREKTGGSNQKNVEGHGSEPHDHAQHSENEENGGGHAGGIHSEWVS